jgi:two-component SAPR family response regulator
VVGGAGHGYRSVANDLRPVLGRPERVTTPADGTAAEVIRVRVLGTPQILDAPADLYVRPQAVEFLTYLIVRGGTVHQYYIATDLMPEPSRRKAGQRMHTYTYNLRQVFTHLGGDASYLRLRRHRYTLERAGFDIDLWTMLDAVADAAEATEPQARIAALRRAVDSYGAPFGGDADYLWLAGYRDLVRREYVDAVLTLAGELASCADQAREVLSEARRHHPEDGRLAAAMRFLSMR